MDLKTKGTFYGVGVGPGDPSFLTLRGAEVLGRCPVIAAPRTGGTMTALEIVRPVVDLTEKQVLPLDYSMSGDPARREAEHHAMIQAILDCLDRGRDVAMVNLGDSTLYASVNQLAGPIRQAGYPVELIPGVTSFSAASAALGEPLAEGDVPVHILSALRDDWKTWLDLPGTKVLMKPGKRLPEVLAYLKETGRTERAALVMDCGMAGEVRLVPFDRLPDRQSYFTLVIVKE